MDTLLHYNLRYSLDPTAEDAEEEARLQAEAAAAAEGGDAAAAQQRVRGAPSEPPLRFRPAVHRTCSFPVGFGNVCVCQCCSDTSGMVGWQRAQKEGGCFVRLLAARWPG